MTTSVSPTPKDTEAEEAARKAAWVAVLRTESVKMTRTQVADVALDAAFAVLAASPAVTAAEDETEPCDHPYCGPLRCERYDDPAPAVTAAEDETGGEGAQVHPFRHALGQPSWRCRDCDAPYNHRIHGKPGLPAPAVTAVPAERPDPDGTRKAQRAYDRRQAAVEAWARSEQRRGTMPRVRRAAFVAGFLAAVPADPRTVRTEP